MESKKRFHSWNSNPDRIAGFSCCTVQHSNGICKRIGGKQAAKIPVAIE
jgi:hypothetical protein